MSSEKISLDQLAQWLDDENRPNNTLNIHQLYGFLFAVCATPVKLKQRDWLPAIFADQLSKINNAKPYLNAITDLQQQIEQDISDFLIALPGDCQLSDPFEINFTGNALHFWSNGFELGLTLTEHFWDNCKTQAKPQTFWMMLSFFSNLHNAQQMAARFQNGTMPVEMLTRHIFSEFNKLMQDYADLARKFLQDKPPVNIMSGTQTNSAGIPVMDNSQHIPVDSGSLIQQAWASDDPVEKVQIAHTVLESDPHNINALMLLAQWEAANSSERRDLLIKAVEGCEKVLGEDFFTTNTGRFWLIRETRTFMEALTNLASTYAHLKDYVNAIACYERAITLNPADNQFNRYPLNNCYIQTRQLEKARQLAEQFSQDKGAFFLFDQALIAFINTADSADSRALKKQALAFNKYVPRLLSGKIKMPKRMPDRLSSGDKDEAVLYAAQNTELWRSIAGSIPWLLKK